MRSGAISDIFLQAKENDPLDDESGVVDHHEADVRKERHVVGTIFPIEIFPVALQHIFRFTPIYTVCYGPAKLIVDFSMAIPITTASPANMGRRMHHSPVYFARI